MSTTTRSKTSRSTASSKHSKQSVCAASPVHIAQTAQSKSKKKTNRKRLSLREGGRFEEEALLEAIAKTITTAGKRDGPLLLSIVHGLQTKHRRMWPSCAAQP